MLLEQAALGVSSSSHGVSARLDIAEVLLQDAAAELRERLGGGALPQGWVAPGSDPGSIERRHNRKVDALWKGSRQPRVYSDGGGGPDAAPVVAAAAACTGPSTSPPDSSGPASAARSEPAPRLTSCSSPEAPDVGVCIDGRGPSHVPPGGVQLLVCDMNVVPGCVRRSWLPARRKKRNSVPGSEFTSIC